MPNLYILVYLVITIAGMAALLYVMWRQYAEVRRPRNAWTKLRVYLFLLPTLIFFGLLLGLPRLFQIVNTPFTDSGQAVRTIAGMIVLAGFSLLTLLIYTYREKK